MTANLILNTQQQQIKPLVEPITVDIEYYPLPALLLNSAGIVVAANQLFLTLCNVAQSHILGHPFDQFASLVNRNTIVTLPMLLHENGVFLDDCQLTLTALHRHMRIKLVSRRFVRGGGDVFMLSFSDDTQDYIRTHVRLRLQERLKQYPDSTQLVQLLQTELHDSLAPVQLSVLLFQHYALQQQAGTACAPLLSDPTLMPQLLGLHLNASATWRIGKHDHCAFVVGITALQQKIMLVFTKPSDQDWPPVLNLLVEMVMDVITNYQQFTNELHHLRELAFKDTLTGLPNRYLLMNTVNQLIQQNNQKMALLFIDIDGLKRINDTYGHLAGDDYLKQLCARLKLAAGEGALLARYAGDEFIIVLPLRNEHQLAAHVQHLTHSVLQPLLLNDQYSFAPRLSMGISIFPDDATTLDELMRKADLAKYQAKHDLSVNHYYFRSEMASSAERRTLLEQRLRQAITSQQLTLNYQPQYDAVSEQICGSEALLRWSTEEGFISPAEFVPLAEQNGFINELTYCAAQCLRDDIHRWLAQGVVLPPISFNLSPLNLETPGFAERLDQLFGDLLRSGVALTLELTERAFLVEEAIIQQNLALLVSRGYKVALDDFGVGYSSLLSLRKFPIQCLKLDKSFIDDIESNTTSRLILSDLFKLTQTLQITALAEGVETAAQLAIVRAAGFQQIQGYYFSKPLSAKQFVSLLH